MEIREKKKNSKAKPKKRIVVDRFRCAYCGACISVCKFNANELMDAFLVIDDEECTACLKCVRICPMRALSAIEVEA